MTSLLRERVLNAALAWWHGKKPPQMGQLQHLECPTVNTLGELDARLARAVAAYSKEQWRKDDAGPLVQDLLELARLLDAGHRASDAVHRKHETFRRAEAFLGQREVKDDTSSQYQRPVPLRSRR